MERRTENIRHLGKIVVGFLVLCTLIQLIIGVRRSMAQAEIGMAPAQTFIVTSTADPGDSTCDATCSLRDAIQAAESNAGTDTISFNISGSGVRTIALTSGLNVNNSPVIIDGTSQPDFAGTPIIELNGSAVPGDCINILAGGSTIRGLIINRCGGNGISAQNQGGNVIAGNYIGVDSTGMLASGNVLNGVSFTGVGSGTIGGGLPADRNIISGNGANGVMIVNAPASGNVVLGNYIGTNAAGTAAIPNALSGVRIDAPSEIIGGGLPGHRNIISGNLGAGVLILNSGSSNNRIQGNFIGTNVAGDAAIPNAFGVFIGDLVAVRGVANSFVGTDGDGINDATEGNVISGNSATGVTLALGGTTNNRVAGNLIGLNAAGTAFLPNGGNGVSIIGGAANNFVGTNLDTVSDDLERNIIAGNTGSGITIGGGGTIGNRISINSIYENGGLGIDLGMNGVTANDPGDIDTGPNNLQNFPVINNVIPGSTGIHFSVNSTPNTTFRVEFFYSVADVSGLGEGQTFLGTTNVTTDASGNFAGGVTFIPTVPTGQVVTATATNLTTGDTSEFSQAVLSPTAAAVAVAGRVLTADGRGIFVARVFLSDANGNVRSALTNAFGFYRFDDVEVGATYLLWVSHKRYSFTPRTVSINDQILDLDFIAEPGLN